MVQRLIDGVWVYITWQQEYLEHATKKGWKQLIPLEEKYPDEEKRMNILVNKMLFDSGETDFSKVMWRMSSGSRMRAFDLAQRIVGFSWGYELSIEDFDYACAEITGGFEVEWEKE